MAGDDRPASSYTTVKLDGEKAARGVYFLIQILHRKRVITNAEYAALHAVMDVPESQLEEVVDVLGDVLGVKVIPKSGLNTGDNSNLVNADPNVEL